MQEKKLFTVIYLLLLVSVVGNVIFFVNWLGSHSNQREKKSGTSRTGYGIGRRKYAIKITD